MGRTRNLLIPGVDKTLLVRDAIKTMPDLTRRRFITGGASLGALALACSSLTVRLDMGDPSFSSVPVYTPGTGVALLPSSYWNDA